MAAIPRLAAPAQYLDGLPVPELLDAIGFQVNRHSTRQVRHTLLRPENLRLVRDENAEERDQVSKWIEDGEPTDTLWDGITLEDVTSEDTLQCLWDLLELAGESVPRARWSHFDFSEEWVERLRRFINRWGLLDHGYEHGWNTDSGAWRSLYEWRDAAQEVRDALYLMIRTEEEELIPDTGLEILREWADLSVVYPGLIVLSPDRVKIPDPEGFRNEQLEEVKRERMAGRGLALQRSAVMNLLSAIRAAPEYRGNDSIDDWPLSYFWDDGGRRVESGARGVREIVASHLMAIFESPQIDVFVCAVCGKPYPLNEAEGQRRPRTGVKRLCSEACRREAKRESNRASWHKNKARWKKQGSQKR